MNNIKFEIVRLLNEDVITTSNVYTCENSKYHFSVDYISSGASYCFLVSSNNGSINSFIAPNSVESSNEIYSYLGDQKGSDYFILDLGQNSAVGDWYYFNGSGWSLCSDGIKAQHTSEKPTY